ncbi:LuxR C-terminal-related transcriptional regulator [Actinoplanes sp. TRM 88003]|uniref:LuxR C-terminal-related transcriptional regulator n=1 Tax=Paractinoplanes aksuensis TaxID=2939490 RepID=A0ABT1DYP1_9ACTN|nr:LuxR C-terminal-related transcriptional regulator [Actinoplanes aksuensis]MCO8275902.1 LuxR C-terminal-related transcriptional regulator [Actinoplanes aksuensis]
MAGETAADPTTTPDGDPIMTVKLDPPGLPPWWVVRERLRDRLDGGPSRRLTLVVGPAGSGKSTLVADWVATGRAGGRVAWLSLEPADDQPGVFWSYVVAALERAGASVPLHRRHATADAVDRSFLVRLAVGLAARPEPIVLVLDDTHVLARESVVDGLHFLIEHAGPQLRVVLIGRTDPLLPLHRHRLAGSVAEVRHGDLAFTAAEAEALLAAHGTRLESAAVVALTERTNGWAAALRLAARARPGTDAVRATPELADYIRSELLAEQTAATRDLLLRTSVAEQLPAGLAVELSGRRDAAQVLDRLAHEGVFVTVAAGAGRSYVHHPQVRSVLLDVLATGPAERVTELHRRAARWYAGSGRWFEAVPYAVRAGEWELAAASVVRSMVIGCFLDGPDADRCARAFRRLPPDLDTAEAALVQAAVAHHLGRPEACAKHLLRAAEIPAATRDLALSLCRAVVELARAAPGERAEAAETAWLALGAALNQHTAVPPKLSARVRLAWAETLLRRHDLNAARQVLGVVLDGPEVFGAEARELLGRLALTEALDGRPRRAEEHARQALDRPEIDGEPPSAAPDVALAWAGADEYDLTAARLHSERATVRLAARPDVLLVSLLALVRARIHRARGDVARAAELLEQPRDGLPAWLGEIIELARTALLAPGTHPDGNGSTARHTLAEATATLADGDTARARATVATLAGRPELPVDVRVEGWLVHAGAELADGHRDRARRALQKALTLAEAEHLRRPLLEAPASLRRFLREERELGVRHDWLGVTPAAAPPAGPGPAPVVVEPLTAKEAEVLGYLAQLLSTEEIARTMYVSVNTVKTHVRGVLRKLAATRRNEAVRRARELGILPG